MENPHCMADFNDCPLMRKPKVPKRACPTTIVITRTRIGTLYSTRIFGSTSIPTETKNIAPKRFFTGSTNFIIFSASIVSARMEPMTNAPKALLNPTCVDTTAMAQHRPSDMMSSVSLFISLRDERSSHGMANMPTTNHKTRKNPMRTTLPSICPPSRLAPDANAESITIITMASMSSRMSTLITMPAKRCCRSPRSSNALYMIVVELMASIPPRNMQSMRPHPKVCPTVMPSAIMRNTMAHVAMMGDEPILRIFLNEKSSPSEKSRNITPMSAHVWMSAMSTTDMV